MPHNHRNLHVGLRGLVHWRRTDRHGRVLQEGRQRNLITNFGLNELGVSGLRLASRYLRVGDSSAAPAVTDTALGSQIAEISGGGFANLSYSHQGSGVWHIQRPFDSGVGGATGNLTEFGTSFTSAGTLFSRALFRDAQGDPVTVPVASDEKLVFTYTLELTLAPLPETPGTGNVTITGLSPSTRGITWAFIRGHESEVLLLEDILAGSGIWFTTVRPADSMPTAYGTSRFYETNLNGGSQISAQAYVADSHERTFAPVTIATNEANEVHAGYGFRCSATGTEGQRMGWVCWFDVGDEFTKAGTHELTLTPPTISWARG